MDIFENLKNPQNYGDILNADGVGKAGNLKRGEIIKFYLCFEGNIISHARFLAYGGYAIPVASIVTQHITGMAVEDAVNLTYKKIIALCEGLPNENYASAKLCEEALIFALADYYAKNLIPLPGRLILSCQGDCAHCHGHH